MPCSPCTSLRRVVAAMTPFSPGDVTDIVNQLTRPMPTCHEKVVPKCRYQKSAAPQTRANRSRLQRLDQNLDAAIGLLLVDRALRTHHVIGAAMTLRPELEADRRGAGLQPALPRLRAVVRKGEIVVFAAGRVAVAVDLDIGGRIFRDHRHRLAQERVGLRLE